MRVILAGLTTYVAFTGSTTCVGHRRFRYTRCSAARKSPCWARNPRHHVLVAAHRLIQRLGHTPTMPVHDPSVFPFSVVYQVHVHSPVVGDA